MLTCVQYFPIFHYSKIKYLVFLLQPLFGEKCFIISSKYFIWKRKGRGITGLPRRCRIIGGAGFPAARLVYVSHTLLGGPIPCPWRSCRVARRAPPSRGRRDGAPRATPASFNSCKHLIIQTVSHNYIIASSDYQSFYLNYVANYLLSDV